MALQPAPRLSVPLRALGPFVREADDGKLYVSCTDVTGAQLLLDVLDFFQKNICFCTFETAAAISAQIRMRQACNLWLFNMDDRGNCNLELASQLSFRNDHDYPHDMDILLPPPLTAVSTVLEHILFRLGGLCLRDNVDGSRCNLDLSRCSVFCLGLERPQPNYVFADDYTPRTESKSCALVDKKSMCKLSGLPSDDDLVINVEFPCAYNFQLSLHEVVALVYVFNKHNRAEPIARACSKREGPMEPTFVIRPGPGGRFSLHCVETKTYVVTFVALSAEAVGQKVQVSYLLNPFLSRQTEAASS